jgi:predicted nucleic-acid-binding protein
VIGLDTNVIVRYFARDHAEQFALAATLIDGLSPEEPAFISTAALVETVWVLQRSYKTPKPEIIAILLLILQTQEFVVQEADIALRALSAFTRYLISSKLLSCFFPLPGKQAPWRS